MRRLRSASKDRINGLHSHNSSSASNAVGDSRGSGSTKSTGHSRSGASAGQSANNSKRNNRNEPPELIRKGRGGGREERSADVTPTRKKRKTSPARSSRTRLREVSSGRSDDDSTSSLSRSPSPRRGVEPIPRRRSQRHPAKRRRTASPVAQARDGASEHFSMELPDVSPIPKVREGRFSSIAGSAAFTPAQRGWNGRDTTSTTREGTMGMAWSTIKSFLFTPAQPGRAERGGTTALDDRATWREGAVGGEAGVTTPTHQSSSKQLRLNGSGNSVSMTRQSVMMDFSHAMATPPPAFSFPPASAAHTREGGDAEENLASINSSAAASPLSSHQRVRQMLRFSINQRAPPHSRDPLQRPQPWTIPEEIEREVDEVHHRLSDVLRMSASHSSDSTATGGPNSHNRTRAFDSNQSQSNPLSGSVSSIGGGGGGGGSSTSSGADRHRGGRVASSSGSGTQGSGGNDAETTRNYQYGPGRNVVPHRVSASTISSIASGDSGSYSRGSFSHSTGVDPSLHELNLSPIAKLRGSYRGANPHSDAEPQQQRQAKHARDQKPLSYEARRRADADELEARKLFILSQSESTAVERIAKCLRIALLSTVVLMLCTSWIAFAWPLFGRLAHAPPAEEHYTRVYVHSQTELHAIYRVPFLSMTREQSEQLRWRIISETLEILDRNVETERLYEFNAMKRGGGGGGDGEWPSPAKMTAGVVGVNRTDSAYLLHLRRQIDAYVALAHRARLYARSRLDSRWRQHVVAPLADTWNFAVRRHGYSHTIHSWIFQPSVWDVINRARDAISCMRQDERMPCPSMEFLQEDASRHAVIVNIKEATTDNANENNKAAGVQETPSPTLLDVPYVNYRWSNDAAELEFFVTYVRNRITEHARDYNRAISK